MPLVNDSFRIFSGRSHIDLAQEICSYLGVSLGECEIFKFKNDNSFVRLKESVRRKDIFIIQTGSPPVNDNLMELVLMVDAVVRASARSITVVLPYYPYCRSDKKDQPRIPISASLVARLLETSGADRVLTVDLHAEQIQGFFKVPVDQLLAAPVICKVIRELNLHRIVAVAPDAGSAKRVRDFADRLSAPMAILDKRRLGNQDDVEILNVIGDVADHDCVIFDDEISTGGSIDQVVKALRQQGAKRIYAALTHGVLCGSAMERIESMEIEGLYVTNTLPLGDKAKHPKITVLSIAPLLGEAIRRILEGESLASLFHKSHKS